MIDGLEERLEEAVAAAKMAGAIISKPQKPYHVKSKGKNDLVSDMDMLSEKTIKEYLSQRFSSDAFLGEEGGYTGPDDPEGVWVIDPIDGSADYIHGMPDWTISIGYMVKDSVELGVVYCPGTRELFSARRGHGAFCNGEPISVSSESVFSNAVTAISPPIRHLELTDVCFNILKKLFIATSDFRELGSAALHLCYVASGKLEGFYEFGLLLHDISAGAIILTEAGGKIADINPDGNYLKTGNIIATNSALAEDYRKLIRGEWQNR